MSDVRLVIVDTLGKVRPSKTKRDVYQHDYATIGSLKHIADHFNIPMIVVHHLRKSEADDPLDQVSGTLGNNGAADTILILSKKRTSNDAELLVSGRDVEEKKYAMQFDKTNCTWSLLGDAERVMLDVEFQKKENYQSIFKIINDNDGEMVAKDIVERCCVVGYKDNSVRTWLSEMVHKGYLIKDKKGVYKTSNKYNNNNSNNIPISTISTIDTINNKTSNNEEFIGSSTINNNPQTIENRGQKKFIGVIGSIGHIVKNEKQQKKTTLTNTDATGTCLSCTYFDLHESKCCENKTVINNPTSSCSYFIRRQCCDCNYYSDDFCETLEMKKLPDDSCDYSPDSQRLN